MKNDINNSLIRTIGKSGLDDIASELGEVALDSIIDNDSLNQIPIIGTLRSIYKLGHGISDYIFIEKLLRFLTELGEVSEADQSRADILSRWTLV